MGQKWELVFPQRLTVEAWSWNQEAAGVRVIYNEHEAADDVAVND